MKPVNIQNIITTILIIMNILTTILIIMNILIMSFRIITIILILIITNILSMSNILTFMNILIKVKLKQTLLPVILGEIDRDTTVPSDNIESTNSVTTKRK